MNKPADAIGAARDLTGALGAVTTELTRLNDYGRVNRKIAWAAGAVAVAALAVAVVILFGRTSQNTATLAQLHAASISSCQSGNQTRSQEIALWQHLAGLSQPPPGETAAQKTQNAKAIAGFLSYVRHVFAPRDCAAAYRLP